MTVKQRSKNAMMMYVYAQVDRVQALEELDDLLTRIHNHNNEQDKKNVERIVQNLPSRGSSGRGGWMHSLGDIRLHIREELERAMGAGGGGGGQRGSRGSRAGPSPAPTAAGAGPFPAPTAAGAGPFPNLANLLPGNLQQMGLGQSPPLAVAGIVQGAVGYNTHFGDNVFPAASEAARNASAQGNWSNVAGGGTSAAGGPPHYQGQGAAFAGMGLGSPGSVFDPSMASLESNDVISIMSSPDTTKAGDDDTKQEAKKGEDILDEENDLKRAIANSLAGEDDLKRAIANSLAGGEAEDEAKDEEDEVEAGRAAAARQDEEAARLEAEGAARVNNDASKEDTWEDWKALPEEKFQ